MWSRQRCNHTMPPKKNPLQMWLWATKFWSPFYTFGMSLYYMLSLFKSGPPPAILESMCATIVVCTHEWMPFDIFSLTHKEECIALVYVERNINTNQDVVFSFRFCPHSFSLCPLLLTCRAWKSHNSGHWYYTISSTQLWFSTNNILSEYTYPYS